MEEAAIESCVIDRSIYNDEYQPYYLDGFKDGAEWQSKQSPWISVKERLPEPDKEVLLYDKNSIWHYVIGWLRRYKDLCIFTSPEYEIKFSTYWVYNDVDVNLDVIHKASVDELIEHFKTKEE